MNIWLTAKECAGLPGLPGTDHNIRNSLNKRAGETETLRRRRAGTKAFEYHIDCLPVDAQEVIRKRHYDEMLAQSSTSELVAVTANQLTLDEVIEKIVRPQGVKKIRIQADSVTRNDKVSIEPGMRAWDALAKAAAGRGLWPWMEPDGTLVVGGPDYSAKPVAHLVLNNDGTGNNILSLEDNRSINGCYSELTILAQSHARSTDSKKSKDLVIIPMNSTIPVDIWGPNGEVIIPLDEDAETEGSELTGTHNFKSVATDPTVEYYRPNILTVGDTTNQEQLDFRAKKKMADARLSGWDILAEVQDHRTDAGILWMPGQRVRITSEPHGIDAIFFLMGREFRGGISGKTTQLRFKEDGVWIPDAFPREKKKGKKKGKGKNKSVAVVDVWSN